MFQQATGFVSASPDVEVTGSCALHPATFWRRVLLAKVRARQLRRQELPASLHALASFATIVPDA